MIFRVVPTDGSKIHKEDVIQSALSDNQITDMQEVLMIGGSQTRCPRLRKFGFPVSVYSMDTAAGKNWKRAVQNGSWIRSKTSKLFWSVSERGRKCRIKTEEKKSSGSTVLADDGFYFGIGAFETIAVEEGIPQLLAWHLERLRDSLAFFGIDQSVEEQEVLAYLNACPQSEEKAARSTQDHSDGTE